MIVKKIGIEAKCEIASISKIYINQKRNSEGKRGYNFI